MSSGLVTTLNCADEVRPQDELRLDRRGKLDAKKLELTLAVIERLPGDLCPERHDDTYRERLLEVVRRKRRGGEIEARAAEEEETSTDLVAALRASVEQAHGREERNGRRSKRSHLEELTVSELGERARKLGIEGRSKTSKRELVSAIERAEC